MVFDRDKLRSQGVGFLSRAGRDLSTLLGGDYVNRFYLREADVTMAVDGYRSLKELTPEALRRVS